MRRPRLNVLRTFEAAGRRLSFSLAADELNISQAAVSQQIRHLEAHLGAALFTRHHRRIALTASGRAYLEVVHETLERLDTATDQLFGQRPHRVVTIKCPSSMATLWLSPQIHVFQARNPDVFLHIRTQDIAGAANRPASADLEIFVSGQMAHGPDVKPLLTATILPVAAPAYLDIHRPMTPGDMPASNLIHILGYEDDWHRWFRRFHGGSAEIPQGLGVDSSLFAIDAALRGDGIFLGRRPFIDSYLKSGELVEVFTRPYHLQADYFLRRNANVKDARASATVSDWLLAMSGHASPAEQS